ncbi:unnamed protein product [Brassicogethes aeneus]|uniref:Retrotransposon gag domain-containing protein n=1 Tax=Brassicogethes aeneus TaxID=1431903 RepID=A0A9P0FHY6_BRAAE|nr:unnamed protein product [Brassicogethes aeneus]
MGENLPKTALEVDDPRSSDVSEAMQLGQDVAHVTRNPENSAILAPMSQPDALSPAESNPGLNPAGLNFTRHPDELALEDHPAEFQSAEHSPARLNPTGLIPAVHSTAGRLPVDPSSANHDRPTGRLDFGGDPSLGHVNPASPAAPVVGRGLLAESNVDDRTRLQIMDQELAQLKEAVRMQTNLIQRLCSHVEGQSTSTRMGHSREERRLPVAGELAHNIFASTPLGVCSRPRMGFAPLAGVAPVTGNVTFSDQEVRQVIMSLSTRQFGDVDNLCRKPTFSAFPQENPVKFLSNVKEYSEVCQIPQANLVLFVKNCLHHSAAVWANTLSSGIDFNQFSTEFLSFFWSPEKQTYLRRHVLGMKYHRDGRASMTEFFMKQYGSLKGLSPNLSEVEIVYEILQQFPYGVQSLWIASADRSFQGTLNFLERYVALSKPSSSTATLPASFDPKSPPPRAGNFPRGK